MDAAIDSYSATLEQPEAAFLKRGYRSEALAALPNAAQSCPVAAFLKNTAIGQGLLLRFSERSYRTESYSRS